MPNIKHSINYTAVIDDFYKTVKIRYRISCWNIGREEDHPEETIDLAIEKLELEKLQQQGYKLVRE